MNTFLNEMTKNNNITRTENGGVTRKSTESKVLDMFAMGGAYRKRSDEDVILLFKNAFEENRELAMKCLFYLRDIRGGQGERRFFRTAFRWLCNEYPQVAKRNLENVSEYGRWDDLIYVSEGTPVETAAFNIIKHQLALDVQCKTPSLLAKWLPSQNASNYETKRLGHVLASFLGMTNREYRKTLSILRERINVLERLMSANRWDEIEFDKIPSKAGLVYRNAFARRDILAKKYETFAKSKDTKVNAEVLYPYEIVERAISQRYLDINSTERAMINKYWSCLPDYLNGQDCSMMCVVDTSGSMQGTPINIAISLGMYCAERIGGPFKNHYISFSSRPQLISIEGVDFVDKVNRIYKTNLCDNTDLEAVFDLLLTTAKKSRVRREDIPKHIVVISDMEIDAGTGSWYYSNSKRWTEEGTPTEMERIRKKWAAEGYKLPHLTYWNVDARHNNILDSGPNVTFVSGSSPTIFKSILTGKTAWDLMIDVLCSKRYSKVTI
jgi:hypothetical protein